MRLSPLSGPLYPPFIPFMPRNFAIAVFVAMVATAIICSVVLKRGRKPRDSAAFEPESNGRTIDTKASLRLLFGLAFLVIAFWVTKGGPLLPRLIGAIVFILFLVGSLMSRL